MSTGKAERQPIVAIAEDDDSVFRSIDRALRFEGFAVRHAADGRSALDLVTSESPDAMILDIGMPELNGLEVCRLLRAMGNRIPILMLTARVELSDRVAGLDAGADDYLVKPFALEELLARLRALLRRAAVVPDGRNLLTVADLVVDPAGRTAHRAGREIDLTKTEFDLLELLMTNAGIVLTRDVIYERIWGYDFETTSNPLDVYVGYLRRKLESEGEARLIHTVRGVGYAARPE
ncbi:response regulator transcription factor [bacterium]|nr:response regulator transcription factor [bacterium]